MNASDGRALCAGERQLTSEGACAVPSERDRVHAELAQRDPHYRETVPGLL